MFERFSIIPDVIYLDTDLNPDAVLAKYRTHKNTPKLISLLRGSFVDRTVNKCFDAGCLGEGTDKYKIEITIKGLYIHYDLTSIE